MRKDNQRPIIILESRNPDTLGDLSLFRDIADAERSLEAIDVKGGEFFGYTFDGSRLALSASGQVVKIELANDTKNYSKIVRKLLEGQARLIFEATTKREKKPVHQDIASLSDDELVTLIGYSR